MNRIYFAFAYSICVFFWTFYGYTKSINEFFCTQRRPGDIVYLQESDGVVDIRFTMGTEINDNYTIFYQYGSLNLNYQSLDGAFDKTVFEYNNKTNSHYKESFPFFDGKNISVSVEPYKDTSLWPSEGFKDRLIYNFEFYDDIHFTSIICISTDKTPMYNSSGRAIYYRYKGFPYLGGESFNKGPPSFHRCRYMVQSKTCSIKSDLLIYMIAASFLTFALVILFGFISLFNDNMKVFYSDFFEILGFNAIDFGYFNFCNPLDKKYKIFKRGEKLITISENIDYGFSSGLKHSFFSNDIWIMNLNNLREFSIFKRKENKVLYQGILSEEKACQVASLLFLMNVDPKNWVVDSSWKHFLSVEDFVILFLKEEKNHLSFLITQNSKTKVFNSCLNLKEILNSKFPYSPDAIDLLINHNNRFFKETGFNVTCLFKVLSGKSGWANRPVDVCNSAWKRYINDVNIFLRTSGYKGVFNHYSSYKKPTKCLVEAIEDYKNGVLENKFLSTPLIVEFGGGAKTAEDKQNVTKKSEIFENAIKIARNDLHLDLGRTLKTASRRLVDKDILNLATKEKIKELEDEVENLNKLEVPRDINRQKGLLKIGKDSLAFKLRKAKRLGLEDNIVEIEAEMEVVDKKLNDVDDIIKAESRISECTMEIDTYKSVLLKKMRIENFENKIESIPDFVSQKNLSDSKEKQRIKETTLSKILLDVSFKTVKRRDKGADKKTNNRDKSGHKKDKKEKKFSKHESLFKENYYSILSDIFTKEKGKMKVKGKIEGDNEIAPKPEIGKGKKIENRYSGFGLKLFSGKSVTLKLLKDNIFEVSSGSQKITVKEEAETKIDQSKEEIFKGKEKSEGNVAKTKYSKIRKMVLNSLYKETVGNPGDPTKVAKNKELNYVKIRDYYKFKSKENIESKGCNSKNVGKKMNANLRHNSYENVYRVVEEITRLIGV